MNIININEKKQLNEYKIMNNDLYENKLEIESLDTIINKDLFNNIKNNQKNNKNIIDKRNSRTNELHCLTDNYQLDIDEIVDENSDINSQNTENSKKISDINNNLEKKDNINYKENYLDFKTFISQKKNEKEKTNKNIKSSNSFNFKKIRQKKTYTPLRKYTFNKKLMKEEKKAKNIEKNEKVKYTKERIEINKQRIINLYNDYKRLLDIRQKKKEELSKEEMKDCSFSPETNKKSKIIIKNNAKFLKPIFLRYNDNKIKKNLLLKKYELTFSHIPKINKKLNINIFHNNTNNTNHIPKKKKNKENKKKNNDIPLNNISNDVNILKREILLDEYINNKKIKNFNNENELSRTPITLMKSKSEIIINKNLSSKKNLNKCQNYLPMKYLNLKRYICFNNNCRIHKFKKDKKTLKNKSFYFECAKGINERFCKDIFINNNITPIISINKMDKYFDNNNFNKSYINSKEDVVQNYINKINANIYHRNNNNEGISYNISEQCTNIKKIVSKNKMKFRIYK